MSSKTIEMNFPEFSDIGIVLSRKQPNDNNETPGKKQFLDFDGLSIEMVSSAKSVVKKEVVKRESKPIVLNFNETSHELKVFGDAPKLKDLPKPKKKMLELNMDQLNGSLNTMQFKCFGDNKTIEKIRVAESAKPVTVNQTVAAPVAEIAGAAGLWATVKPKAAELDKPVEAPAVTPEDWEIFKLHMDLPEPQTCYNKLLELGKITTPIANREEFVCPICESFVINGEGIVLKNCLHNFCRICLVDEIKTNHDLMGQVKCPFPLGNCNIFLEDVEVKSLLGDDFSEFFLKVMEKLEEKLQPEDPLPKLLNNEKLDVIENFEVFECKICYVDAEIGDGVIIRNCTHKFCKECLIGSIKHSDDFNVKCPEVSCKDHLQEREVRKLVSAEVFDKHLEKSLKIYQSVSETAVHCKTPNCPGWVEADKTVRGFTCPACDKVNCIGCKAIHQGKNCQEFQDEVNPDGKHKRENEESENAIKTMIASNLAMWCPQCGIPVEKTIGCDYITCSACKLGICWVTKKPRHAITRQNGTVIDGCHCRENGGPLCHPACKFCH